MTKKRTKRSASEPAASSAPSAAESKVAEFAATEPVVPAADPGPPALEPDLASGDAGVVADVQGQVSADAPAEVVGEATPAVTRRGPRPVARFLIAFAFGLLAMLAVTAGALAAYESSNATRILPGVHSGDVDLSGLSPSAAAARLREAYAPLGDGTLVLGAGDTERAVTFADLGRRIDVDAIVVRAMAIGRDGATFQRIAENVRILVRGTDVAPSATFERAALRREVEVLAAQVAVQPTDASVEVRDAGFILEPGADGRLGNVDDTIRAAEAVLSDPASSSEIRIEMSLAPVAPDVTTDAATAARDAADRIAVDTTLTDGARSWTITAAAMRGWISFAVTPDGRYGPIVAREGLEAGLAPLAADIARDPVDASFLFANDRQVVGVTEAKDGRALDVVKTVDALARMVNVRAGGLSVSRVPITVTTIAPSLSTAEATKTAPLMKPISQWTTYFPVGIKNGGGVNIWIPAREINGKVILPGAWFDFWKAIGPVTRDAGYKDGGAIINGKTEPQGALAGGICSCSTTLFNAALRAGLEMGARRNHYYYIDRYPLGLDATVFDSGSGSVQTMSFRNDTEYPILVRGTGWSVGSKGYVKFVLWSVPTGRTISLSTPIVKNVLKARDTTVYTTSLAPGTRQRVEYAVDGKDVWVTRTVKDAAGAVIHQETYYSHYARITGILQIGVPPDSPLLVPSPN